MSNIYWRNLHNFHNYHICFCLIQVVPFLSLWPSVMWVVISGTVRDHKSQLSQKKVTHGLTQLYIPTLLAYIFSFHFLFCLVGHSLLVNVLYCMMMKMAPSSLVCILSWMFSPDRRTGTIYSWPPSPPTNSHTAAPQSRKGAKASIWSYLPKELEPFTTSFEQKQGHLIEELFAWKCSHYVNM